VKEHGEFSREGRVLDNWLKAMTPACETVHATPYLVFIAVIGGGMFVSYLDHPKLLGDGGGTDADVLEEGHRC
jgi:hypothetical protein